MKKINIPGFALGCLCAAAVWAQSQPASLQDQWTMFQSLGFALNPGVTLADLDRWDSGAYEEQPYELLYVTLGETIERPPWTPLTNNVWHFDTEAIEGPGSYVEIMENLRRLSKGQLPFENIRDRFAYEEERAFVSFSLHGEQYEWELKLEDDWVDMTLFSNVAALATIHGSGRYTYFDTGGQDMVLGWATPEQLQQLTSTTGLNIIWVQP